MPQTNFTTDILPQESRTELSGAEFLKKLQKKREASKKDWNRNVFTVRTNDDISSMIKEYCQINNISPNRFLNDLLNSYFTDVIYVDL